MVLFGPVVGGIILIIGCFILRSGLLSWRKQRQLRLQGITVQGQVVERYQKRRGRQLWYYFTCRYRYEGRTYVCDQPVWRDHYEKWESLVSVRCLPQNPKVAIVLEDDFQRMIGGSSWYWERSSFWWEWSF